MKSRRIMQLFIHILVEIFPDYLVRFPVSVEAGYGVGTTITDLVTDAVG